MFILSFFVVLLYLSTKRKKSKIFFAKQLHFTIPFRSLFFFLKKNRGQEEMVLKSMSAVIFLFHEISAQNENILKRSNCQFN